jgi:DNA modification methylase
VTPTDRIGPDVALYHADAREVIPHLPARAFVIVDPPYGAALTQGGSRADRGAKPAFRRRHAIAGDASQAMGIEILRLCHRRGWPVAAFAKPEAPWPGKWRQHLVWDKGEAVGVGGDRKTCWKRTWELIQVRSFPEVYGERESSVLRFPVSVGCFDDGRKVPYEKPVKLLRHLVRKLVPEGGLVIDPCMGMGSTLLACMQLGRQCIGIESDAECYSLAKGRMLSASGKDSLFAVTSGLF